MSDELRAAAERFRQRTRIGIAGPGIPACDEDAHALADAYLAEHPADDAEPVSEEWLLLVGFASSARHPQRLNVGQLSCSCGSLWCYGGVVLSRTPMTRGDVRRLCQALGVELKEPS